MEVNTLSRTVILEGLEKYISPNRLKHTLGVEEFAILMARTFAVDEERVSLAAILHDCGKELPREEIIRLARLWGWELTEEELAQPGELLHAPASAVLAQERFKLSDEEILSAISCHTLGKENMSKLEKIIFIADMVEPNRKFPGVEGLRELALRDLDLALKACLEHTIAFLQANNKTIHPQTYRTLASIN